MSTPFRTFMRLLVLTGALAAGPAAAAEDMASALVRATSERMLTVLQERRADIDRNPSLIYGLVDKIVLPHFDFERITQGAVGQYWRKASPAQQRDLVNRFKQVLVRTYARSLLNYSGEEIRYLPLRPGSRSNTVTVSTEVSEPGGAPIPIDYRMYNNGSGWKVYDVVINNASLVGNYRSSFAAEIRQKGVDGLITKLGDMNSKGQG